MERSTSLIMLAGLSVFVLAVGAFGLVVFLKIRKMDQAAAKDKKK